LIDVLNENGYYEIKYIGKSKIEITIEQIKEIVNLWKNNSILLIGGSYLFKIHSPKSDIDCILLIPYNQKIINWEIIVFEEFLGKSECNLQTRKCEGWSLYCILCWDSSTESLTKIKSNIFLIKLVFSGFEFDLTIVTLPFEVINNLLPKYGQPNVENIDNLIESFLKEIGGNKLMANKWSDRRKGMLLVLSDHSIYGGKFGFINGTTLTILICNIILQNPHSSIIKIFKEFMQKYSQK
uniref:NTP_transf_2 domain-containing protein n=1 Tax=Meloidogyne hapla TaxID=6305 RepID=A0A1I8BH66_MELHA